MGRQTSTRSFLQASSTLKDEEDLSDDDDDDDKTPKHSRLMILQAAGLIAGTTVGGGFLALPTVVAPNGFVPSAVGLMGVWTYFWCTSLVVVESLLRTRQSSMDNSKDTSHPGLAAAADSAFGAWGKLLVVLLLVVLTEATLVSQISRAGTLLLGLPYRQACAGVTLAVASMVFGLPKTVVTLCNSLLTAVFLVMAVVLFGAGAPQADRSILLLPRTQCDWTGLPHAIPTLLQLLVYGEILPTVCRFCQYQVGPIRWAITLGSLLPLMLEIGWAGLGMGLFAAVSSGGTSSSTVVATKDPVDLLLSTGPVQLPLLILAMTAIATTMIGSFLALESALQDFFPRLVAGEDKQHTESKQEPQRRRRTQLWTAACISLPSLAIASISPQVFLKAIDFAGSYPVLLLWGLAPPAILWKQRQRQQQTNNSTVSPIPKWWLAGLTVVSVGLLAMSAAPDLWSLWKALTVVLVRQRG